MVRRPDGTVGLGVNWTPPFVAPDPGRVGTWHPRRALPAPERAGRRVEIFYTPHPDDETLSMSPLIVRAASPGVRVIVVSMTDGITTGALRTINARLRRDAWAGTASSPPLAASTLGSARDHELFDAARALGVAAGDVFFAHLDAPKSDCGTWVSVGEAADVMKAFAKRFPGATHVTMSYVAERNLDHLACGAALRALANSRVIRHAEWTVSRLWWSLPSPPVHWVVPASVLQQREVATAARAYDLWDPAHQSYAIGEASVPSQFRALLLDPRALVHASPGLGQT